MYYIGENRQLLRLQMTQHLRHIKNENEGHPGLCAYAISNGLEFPQEQD